MSLPPGERLGPYEIVALLGAGGMGEVYEARDTRLGRAVAIKISQAAFSERFEREARTVSALNHPNICLLYDVGPNYLVMELVDGSPVAAVDTPRRLLDLAVQIADGLAAAHDARIVHRDLKPDNILVARDGRVKVLDFGLAAGRPGVGASDSVSTLAATAAGTILGTVNDMSPEQARGVLPLTPQSDQFSEGVVLYELATGKRAFQRDSAAETMTAIIREDAAPLPAATPLPLQWTISRLLAKDPGDRYESTRDLYRELRQIRDRWSSITGATEHAATATPLVRSKARPTITLAAGVAAGALLAAAALTLWRSVPVTTPATPRRDLSAYRFTPVATDTVREQAPAWSPDGKSGALRLARPGEAPVEFAAPKEVAATVGRRLVGFSPDGSAVACIAGQHFPSIGE